MLRIAFRSAFIASNFHSRYLAAAAAASVKVPTDLLKQLRERTGSPMMECKNALVDANLDIEKAVDVLRKKGAVHASKAAGRQASCGLVATAVSSDHQSATVVELNCETDFVERNERFQVALHAVVNGTLQLVPASSTSANTLGVSSLDLAQVNAAKTSEGTSVGDTVNMLISAIRENIVLRRASTLSVPSGVVGAYVHNTVRPSLGRVASLVALTTSSPAVTAQPETKAALLALADKLAMHTAGVKPLYTNRASVPKDVVDREEAIHLESVKNLKKPESVTKNIVAGKMNKFYSEIVLAEQTFAVPSGPEEEVAISKLIANEVKRLKLKPEDVQLSGHLIWTVGQSLPTAEAAKTTV